MSVCLGKSIASVDPDIVVGPLGGHVRGLGLIHQSFRVRRLELNHLQADGIL